MKTLYISDLDGTLLTPSAELSEESRRTLIRLSKGGVHFSAATARTAATVTKILGGVPLSVPVILMNGACIFDLREERYVRSLVFSADAKKKLFSAVSGTSGFLYTVDGGALHTFYERTDTEHSREFVCEREVGYGKVFTKIERFSECLGRDCVYFSVAGIEEELRPLYDTIQNIDGLRTEFYRDIYKTDFWYLEVCHADASKHNAALWLKKEYSFDRLIGFGDNLNDLSLFDACDESFAVANAKDEVKARASGVIGANTQDAVVKFISERTGL